jgi:hypothetical protein
VILLKGVIVLVRAGAKLYLLYGNKGLLGFGLFRLLLLLVLVLSKVDDAADGRLGLGGNLDEIKPLAARNL